MEQISQLKQMREEAIARLQVNPDFKLVNSLDALIRDLVEFSNGIENTGVVQPDSKPVAVIAVDDEPKIENSDAPQLETDLVVDAGAELQDEIAQEISSLAQADPEAASDAIEALEAELTAATSDDEFEGDARGGKNSPDASGMLN